MTNQTAPTSVDIPAELHEKIRSRMDGTDFETIQEYVLFVLEAVVRDESPEPDDESAVDDEQLQSRLEDLGYL